MGLGCLLTLPAQPGPSAGELQSWFASQNEGAQYLAYRTEIQTLFNQATAEQLPAWVLMEKLKEGAAKKIPGPLLLNALQEELAHLLLLRDLLDAVSYPPLAQEAYDETLKTLELYLRGGFSPWLLQESLSAALQRAYSHEEILLLCEALFKIEQASRLSDEQLRSLALALLDSSLAPAGYLAVSSLFIKGKIHHLQEATLLELITTTLARGGGLIQLNDEFNRRTRKR